MKAKGNGTPMKSEMKTYRDRASGVEVTQLTDHKGHSHHFYFTNPGWYAQGRKLLFAPGDIVGHEYWFKDGIQVGFHGHTRQGKPMLGHVRFDDSDPRECEFPGQTGHIFSLDDAVIVGDGNGVIRAWRREDDRYSQPRILCRHDSAMRIQQTHPHPRISPDGRYVVFSSDRSGYGNVYRVPLVAFDSLPPADPQAG